MEILPTRMIVAMVFSFKILIVMVGLVMAGVSYFQAKEARKMERKLSIALPGSVDIAMSLQLLFSLLFLFASTIFLFVSY